MIRVALLATVVLAVAGAAAAGTTTRTFSVTPARQFVTVAVQIRGAHWPAGPRCPAKVRLAVHMPSGRWIAIGAPKLLAGGRFRAQWRPPRGLGGHTVRLRARESCGSAGTVTASRTVQVLPTP